MDELPVEMLIEIFNHLSDPTSLTEVSSYIKAVATTKIRNIHLKVSTEPVDRLLFMRNALDDFRGLRKMRLEISGDVNNAEKAQFLAHFHTRITSLTMQEMSFLNLYFEDGAVTYDSLESLTLDRCDLATSSNEVAHFIIDCCPQLKNLTINECPGLEIDSLNFIGERLHQTNIESLQLNPSYAYFDVPRDKIRPHWSIDKLKELSIRSKFTIIQKNFILKLIGVRNENLHTFELIAELEFDEPLVSKIVANYPNLTKLSIGKGCNVVTNQDFVTICNTYPNLNAFEFHFHHSESFHARELRLNESITDLTLGITLPITHDNLFAIGKCLPNVARLNIIRYHPSSTSTQQTFLNEIANAFTKITYLVFQRTGSNENLKFSAIKKKVAAEKNDKRIRDLNEIKTTSSNSVDQKLTVNRS